MSGIDTDKEQQVKELIRDVVSGPNSHVVFEKMSKDPWIYDPIVSEDEVMYYKLKDKWPRCGMSAKHHRDDCTWSMQQLMFAELEQSDKFYFYLDLIIQDPNVQEKMKRLKKDV